MGQIKGGGQMLRGRRPGKVMGEETGKQDESLDLLYRHFTRSSSVDGEYNRYLAPGIFSPMFLLQQEGVEVTGPFPFAARPAELREVWWVFGWSGVSD